MGVCFPRPNEGGAQFLKPRTQTRRAVMRVRFRTHTRAKCTYTGMTKERSRAAILVSKEHLTLFFYSSPSLFYIALSLFVHPIHRVHPLFQVP